MLGSIACSAPGSVVVHPPVARVCLLHVACQSGNKRAVKFCLRKGLDVDARNADGQTPLHHCFALGHSALAAYLIDKGADDSLRNAAGLTPYEGTRLHDDSPAEERVGHFRR